MIMVQMALASSVTEKLSTLRTIVICNDGTGTKSRGNYDVTIHGKNGRVLRKGRVENWARKSKTPEALLAAAIEALEPKKG